MTSKTNLRFLLALGNQKVVVLSHPEGTNIYTDTKKQPANVSVKRIAEVISNR